MAASVFAEVFDFADEYFEAVDFGDLVFCATATLREFEFKLFDFALLVLEQRLQSNNFIRQFRRHGVQFARRV